MIAPEHQTSVSVRESDSPLSVDLVHLQGQMKDEDGYSEANDLTSG
jgi:hypothetical protein